MLYVLMHKRVEVADLEMDDETGLVQKIHTVYAPEHLPVGASFKNGITDRAALNAWWRDRSIPASRSGVREALETLQLPSTHALLFHCLGLSLSDQYWIKPLEAALTWDKVNFFDNAFSDDMGDVLFGISQKEDGFDLSSPDNTSDGCLKKRWKILDGKRCLLKGGSGPFYQQPLNEVIACAVMQRLGVPHVPYTAIWRDGFPYSVCEDFVTPDTELVSAWRIIQTQKKSNNASVYQHFVNCCAALGVDVVPSLDRMLVTDYLIANEDRHLNNFGLLRHAESLQWLGFAPIFDSGSSLGYDKAVTQLRAGWGVECKPFKKSHAEQLKLVSDFSWIDFDKLSDIGKVIANVLSQGQAHGFLDAERIAVLADAAGERVQTLEKMAHAPRQTNVMVTTEGDVEQDVAADYTQSFPQ